MIEWEWELSEGILWGDRKVLCVARSVFSFLNLCLKFCWFLCWRKMILIQTSLLLNLPFYLPSKFGGFLIVFFCLILFLQKSFITFIYFECICVCMGVSIYVCARTHTAWHICDGQRTAYRSRFSPSTLCVLGMALRSTSLVAEPFTNWAILPALSNVFFSIRFLHKLFSVWLKPGVFSENRHGVRLHALCIPRFLMSPHTTLHWAVDFLSTKGSACFPVHLRTWKAKA